MFEMTIGIKTIKEKMKEAWSAGDFGVIAKIIEPEGEAFINRLRLQKGKKLLDVACGTGNLAIPAARLGAEVTGLDLVANLIRQAEVRANLENLNVRFEVGDAEEMPFEDNEFDYVVSMFGAMFAPRPDLVAKELLRVCKPGGIIAMANWTPEGSVGEMFRLIARYVPPPPGLESPALWGVEKVVRDRFGDNLKELIMNRQLARQQLPMTPTEVVEHFRKFFGPTQKAFNSLNENEQNKFRHDLIELWTKYNISKNGITEVDAEYLEIKAVKK